MLRFRKLYDEDTEAGTTAVEETPETDNEPSLEDSLAESLNDTEETPPETEEESAEDVEVPETEERQAEILQQFKEKYGRDFTDKYESDEEFAKGVDNLTKKIGERDEDAVLGKELRPLLPQFQEWLSGQTQQPAEEKTWGPTPWNQEWNQWIEQTEEGPQLKDSTPADVKNSIAQWEGRALEWERQLRLNPREALAGLREEVKKDLLAELRQQQEQQQRMTAEQAEAQELFDARSKQVYEHTEDGRVVRDSAGQPVMTAWGQEYIQSLQQVAHLPSREADELAFLRTQQKFAGKKQPSKPKPKPSAREQARNTEEEPGEKSLEEELLALMKD